MIINTGCEMSFYRKGVSQTGLPEDLTTPLGLPSQSKGFSVSSGPRSSVRTNQQVFDMESFKFSSSTFTSDNSARLMLGANTRRKYLLIQNTSVNNIYIGFGTLPNLNGINALILPPNSGITFENKIVPNNDVYVVSALQSSVTVVEGTVI